MEKHKDELIFLKCRCGCSMFVVEKTVWEDGEVHINITSQDSRYDHANQSFLSRIKGALKILFGKPVYYSDIFIDKENMHKLKDFVSKLNKMIDDTQSK